MIRLTDLAVSTFGANVIFNGPTEVTGNVFVDSATGAAVAGDILFAGPVTAAVGTTATLNVDAVGASAGGYVEFSDRIGAVTPGTGRDLNGLSVTADVVSLREVAVEAGDLTVDAASIDLVGSLLRTSDSAGTLDGAIILMGNVTTLANTTDIRAVGNLEISGTLMANLPSDNVQLTSGLGIQLDADLSDGAMLTIVAGTNVELQRTLTQWSSVDISAGGEIRVSGPQIEAGLAVFQSPVVFEAASTVTANSLRFDGSIDVQSGITAVLDGTFLDSIGQATLAKLGGGTVVLLGSYDSSTDILVQAGRASGGRIGKRERRCDGRGWRPTQRLRNTFGHHVVPGWSRLRTRGVSRKWHVNATVRECHV